MKDKMTLDSLVTILRGKEFTGAVTFKEGRILFIEGSIKLASYGNDSGEMVLDILLSLPLSSLDEVVQLSKEEVHLWLMWQKLLFDEKELSISPLPKIDRRSLERVLNQHGLAHLLVKNSSRGE